MVTPPDGQPGRMQMYLFKSPYPAVNGGDDASVVYHEYTHGLTNRLVGNDGQANGLLDRQSQAMGEGWSDWYAMDFLTAQGHARRHRRRPASRWSAPTSPTTRRPASARTRSTARSAPPRPPARARRSPAPAGSPTPTSAASTASADHPAFEVHADGEIWAETLWDLRRAVGATAARGLITSALRLSPKQPTFLDMRDAILRPTPSAAGAPRADLGVFAARGMGYSASVTSANATHATAAFDTPPVVAGGAPDVTPPRWSRTPSCTSRSSTRAPPR